MCHRIITFLFLTSLTFKTIITLPNGAPESVCDTLLPFHGGGIPPATTRSPFRVVTRADAVNQGQILHVQIESLIPELVFGGFMIQARSINPPYDVVGRFAPSVDGLVKLINCRSYDNSATHTSPQPKNGLDLQWQAPSDFLGEVVFK